MNYFLFWQRLQLIAALALIDYTKPSFLENKCGSCPDKLNYKTKSLLISFEKNLLYTILFRTSL